MASQIGGERPAVTVRAISGVPAEELIKAGEGADLLVVGSRGSGGFGQLRLGSVSSQVTHHAPCPVVVVPRRPPEPTGRAVTLRPAALNPPWWVQRLLLAPVGQPDAVSTYRFYFAAGHGGYNRVTVKSGSKVVFIQ